MTVVLTVLAGAVGAVARFVVDAEMKSRWKSTVPWATIGINVSGSFVLGVLAGVAMFHAAAPAWQTVLGTGFCGGYTTFSTVSFESVRLVQQREHSAAAINIVLTLGASLVSCAAGLFAASAL